MLAGRWINRGGNEVLDRGILITESNQFCEMSGAASLATRVYQEVYRRELAGAGSGRRRASAMHEGKDAI